MARPPSRPTSSPADASRVEAILQVHRDEIVCRTDRIFALLLLGEWAAAIVVAMVLSPRTWSGTESAVHTHVWAALTLGGAIVLPPAALGWFRPGAQATRHVVAIGQMLIGALLIHLTGGRIETHFHVFGSLAFLAFYRDWRVLVTATIVVTVDHVARGIWWPQSVYGVLGGAEWRWVEHAFWVVFENIFLGFACFQAQHEMRQIAERHAQLETSEARYRLLVDRAPYGVLVEQEGRFVFANPRALAILGADGPDGVLGRPVDAFRPVATPEPGADRVAHADEEAWLRCDGTVFRGEATAVAYDHEGRPGELVLLQDVTARRVAEEQRDRFFSLSLDMLCIAGTDGRFRRINPAFSQTLGWTDEELLSQPFIELVHPDDVAATVAEMEKLSSGLATSYFENRYRCRDGSYRWLAWKSAPQPDGLIYATARDLTENKQAESALRASEAYNRGIVESSQDCLEVLSLDGRRLEMAGAGRRLMGVTDFESIRHSDWLSLWQEADRGDALRAFAVACSGGTGRFQGSCPTFDGARRWWDVVVTALPGPDGAPDRLLAVSRDMTRQREAEEEVARRAMALTAANHRLEQANADAQQASRAKSAFLAAMSHEIRTPMNGVIGMAEMLAQSRLPDQHADAVRTIRDSAVSLLGIIDDILDFSKIEAGRLDLERAPASVSEIVEGICNSLAPVASGKQVDLALFIHPDVPDQVWSDPTRVRQVLYNLVGNAIKFSAGRPRLRGRVSVRVEVAPDPLRLVFRVADNGIGMSPATLEKLFAPFAQGEVSTTRRFGGTGLGLVISQRLVELLQGTITVESVVDEGATFTVTLPIEPVVDAPRPALQDLTGVDCVVVARAGVDSDGVCTYLDRAGARIRVAPDPTAAATLARGTAGAVVIQFAATPDDADIGAFVDLPHVRHLLLVRIAGRRPSQSDPHGPVTLSHQPLQRAALLDAVGVASGRVHLETPVSTETPQAGGDTVPAGIAEARARGRLILVAEDDDTNKKVILRQLALLGHTAEVASDGAEALRMWRRGGYALLLSDLHMPELDGYGLADTIRREEAAGMRMPILALTANALRGEANRALAAGMQEYLTKPVQLEVLPGALARWLPDPVNDPVSPSSGRVGDPPAAPVVDVGVLRALVGDDDDTVRDFLADYLVSTRAHVLELRAAVAANDSRHFGAVAHKMKSASRSVGALALGDLCAELENAGRADDRDSLPARMAELDRALPAVEAEITNFLDRKAS